MASREMLKHRLEFKKQALAELEQAYLSLIQGRVKSYAIGSRNLTKFDLQELEDVMEKLQKEIDSLEIQLHGGKSRKAVGIIPRDW